MKILHAPHNVAGNAFTLSRAERSLGHKSSTMCFTSSPLGFSADYMLNLDKLPMRKARLRALCFFLKAIAWYDIFHFSFGDSLLSYFEDYSLVDLSILKRLGKKIFMTFQGCDIRNKDYCLSHYTTSACAHCTYENCTPEENKRKQQRAEIITYFADRVYVVNPDLLKLLPEASFLPYACVNLKSYRKQNQKERKPGMPLKILHAPTSRSIKGTDHVISAVETLKKDGAPVELILVEQTPHEKAAQIYRQADIAIDQLLVGWYGAFAVETMALGIPTMCYLRDEDLSPLPFKDRIPLVRTAKETLKDDLSSLIQDRDRLLQLSLASRAYVEDIHDPVKITARLIEDYSS